MKRIAVLIPTTNGPVLVDRITPEPAPQSMVCLKRSSEVLPISGDYDDFVRAGSGVILRDFGPQEEGAFRLDVSGPIGTGKSWQLAVYIAHAIFKSKNCELSDLETADHILWLTGTLDYDLNVADVDHVAEKVEASALLLADFLARKTPIMFVAAPKNAAFLGEHQPPAGIEVVAIEQAGALLNHLGIIFETTAVKPKSNSFWWMSAGAFIAIIALFMFVFQDQGADESLSKPEVQKPLISLSTDIGRSPIYYFGDELNLIVSLEKSGWVQCFYHQVNGDILRIYPNAQLSQWQKLAAGQSHVLSGAKDSEFVITLGAPAGREKVACHLLDQPQKVDKPEEMGSVIASDQIAIILKP